MASTILALLLGLITGAVIGWFLHQRQRPTAPPAPPHQPADPALPAAQLQASLTPLHEAMGSLAGQVRALEDERTRQLSSLAGQMQSVMRTSTRLADRTDDLVTSLRSPQVRGRWGEMQLERVVELGGMTRHCDFDTQVSGVVDGKRVRPDLVVRLSGDRSIIVDAKVPYAAYLDALEATDPEEHQALLRRHAHQVRHHVAQLAARDYIGAFSPTPEFVVLFVPADPFLDAALGADPSLLDDAFASSVVIATPTTLFALLRTVALGWRQEDVTDKAREIHRLGREFYARLGTMNEHYDRLGRQLEKSVEAYNSTLASLDSRVGVTARKLAELGVPTHTDTTPVSPQAVAARPRHASFEQPAAHGNEDSGGPTA